jgi:hypothetical protein
MRKCYSRVRLGKREYEEHVDSRDDLASLSIANNRDTIVFVASECKWATEYADAVRQQGQLNLKRITELLAFGYGVVVDSGTHVRILGEAQGHARVSIEEGIQAGKEGWVPSSWVR